jgi:hypothetical protein
MQHTKTFFLYFSLSKTQTLHLITIKVKKPYISQILKALINQLLNPNKICRNMFLHFHEKYKHNFICPFDT